MKELAQEARFIRFEEHKARSRNREDFWKLRLHRTNEVRDASRAALLAYAFLRGKPLKSVEQKTHDPDWKTKAIQKEVRRLAAKFGGKNFNLEVDEWFKL